jgi:hypothetical protein
MCKVNHHRRFSPFGDAEVTVEESERFAHTIVRPDSIIQRRISMVPRIPCHMSCPGSGARSRRPRAPSRPSSFTGPSCLDLGKPGVVPLTALVVAFRAPRLPGLLSRSAPMREIFLTAILSCRAVFLPFCRTDALELAWTCAALCPSRRQGEGDFAVDPPWGPGSPPLLAWTPSWAEATSTTTVSQPRWGRILCRGLWSARTAPSPSASWGT